MTGASDSIGEVTLPNGLQAKWGFRAGLTTGATHALDFTDEGLTDFDNACFQVFTGIRGSSASDEIVPKTSSYGTDGFSATNTNAGTVTWNWFAIGR